MNDSKRALVLLNLGTPDRPDPESVGRYLKEFLMDKWVIDIPYLIRLIFVHLLIVPRRKFASAKAYQTIWKQSGSPLLINLLELEAQVNKVSGRPTEVAMRYGNPSIESALWSLSEQKDIEEVQIFPLYPQYAESSTRSSREECERVAREVGLKAKLTFVQDFFEHPGFINPLAARIAQASQEIQAEHLLFSYHGLPERHIMRLDQSGSHCLQSKSCCDSVGGHNRLCYRAQCYATSRAVAKALGLKDDAWSVSFQSRLGRTPWIQPFTDVVLPHLAQRGIRRLAVACPSFVADCLETIEEIGDRGRQQFLQAGGEKFINVPCLNSDPAWAQGLLEIAAQT